MSSLDINKVVTQLQSSKAKDRNVALSLLQTISSSKLKLNLKQFGILTVSLFKLIEIEKSANGSSLTNPVESRLSIASNLLMSLVERCFTSPNIVKLKYKNCITFINSILDSFYISPTKFTILEPTAFDFLSILNILLPQSIVRENYEPYWEKIYDFVINLSNHLLDSLMKDHENIALYEQLLSKSLTALKYLIDTSPTVSRLHVFANNSHSKLLSTIQKVAKLLETKENNVIIVVIEIINKCLIVLANHDAQFLHEIIKVTVKLFVQFANAHYESLKVQLLIFVNLESVHNYINYQSLTGSGVDDAFIYNIGILIQNLLSKSPTPEYQFNRHEIGMVLNASQEETWFNLKTIYFTPLNSDLLSHPWLLHQGLAKLLNSYFRLKQSSFPSTSSVLEDYFDPRHNSKAKRQKLDYLVEALYSSHNTIQFLNSLIDNKDDERVQATALKVLTFYLETEIPSDSPTPTTLLDQAEELVYDYTESTLFNASLSLTRNETDKSIVFKTILSSFDNSRLSFWSLLAAASLLYNIKSNNEMISNLTDKLCHLLLKLCLPLVKSKDFGHVACNLIYLMISFQKENDYHKIVTKSIISQLDSIIDLSEVNGPNCIRDESFRFWYAIDAILIERESSKRVSLREAVFRWSTAKWNDSFLKSTDDSLMNLSLSAQISQFICWLSSSTPRMTEFIKCSSCSGAIADYFYLMHEYSQLQRFTNLRNTDLLLSGKHIQLSAVEGASSSLVDTLFNRIIETFDFFESPKLLLHWSLVLYKVLQCLEPTGTNLLYVSLFESKIVAALQTLSVRMLHSLEVFEIILAINSINEIAFSNSALAELARIFPLETIIDHYLSKSIQKDVISLENGSSNFEDEFNSTSPLPSHEEPDLCDLSYITLIYHRHDASEIATFIVRLYLWQNRGLEHALNKLLEYLKFLECSEQLFALHRLFVLIEETNLVSAKDVSTTILIKLVRFIGEGPMVDDKTEHSELTVTVLCKLLKFLRPQLGPSADKPLQEDCTDLFDYLVNCYREELIVTESSLAEFCSLCLIFSKASGVLTIEPSVINPLFIQVFGRTTNNVKISLLPFLRDHLKNCRKHTQMELYKSCLSQFHNPERTIETSSTFSLFCSQLASTSEPITTFAIYNLIEHSQFPTFSSYCETSLLDISKSLGLVDTKSLYNCFKFEILKCWLHRDIILRFPWALFGYRSYEEFCSSHYREILALQLASTSKNEVLQLSKLMGSDIQTLLADSLPFCISLSYTPSCVRDQIFKRLEGYLQREKFKSEMKSQLVVIVFQILLQTDMNLEDLIRSSNLSSISLESSESLLKAIIEKYHGPYEQFWLLRVQFFLIRRISLLVHQTVRVDKKVNCFRVIKMVMLMRNNALNDVELVRLIIEIITPHLVGDNVLKPTALEILENLNLNNMTRFQMSAAIPLIIHIVSELVPDLYNNGYNPEYQILGDSIRHYSNSIDSSSSIKILLQKVSSHILDAKGVKSLSSNEVGLILGNKEEMGYFPNNRSRKSLLLVISLILNDDYSMYETRRSELVVKVLLQAEISDNSSYWKNLDIWSLKYLGAYFLEGGVNERIDDLVDLTEYHGHGVEAVASSTKNLDLILDLIISSLDSENTEIVACAETVVAVLMWKYNEIQASVLNYINFDNYRDRFTTFVEPISFHCCTLLYPIEGVLEPLTTVTDNFPTTFESFDSWTSKLLISFLGELARVTDIATLFVRYVDHVKTFAKKALPHFICYYLSYLRTAGAANIINLFEQYINSNPSNKELIDLFTRILLLIRMAAKSKNQIFRLVYSKLNVQELSKIASKNKLYKTSLMLYEDSYGEFDGVFDQNDRYRFLLDIYESIDDDDLVYGLPEETSLDHALRLITRNNDPSSKIVYDSGYLDAKSLLKQPLNDEKILSSLIGNGSLGISRLLSKSLASDKASCNYEWAWKLNTWEIPLPKRSVTEHEVIYKALKQCHDSVDTTPAVLQKCQLEALANRSLLLSPEFSTKELRLNSLQWFRTLASLTIMETTFQSLKLGTIRKDLNDYNAMTSWFDLSELNMSENITLSRMSILNILSNSTHKAENERDLNLGLFSEIFRYGCIARANKATQKMVSSTILMDEVVKSSNLGKEEPIIHLCKFHTASTLWEQGYTTAPVGMLKELFMKWPYKLPIQALNIEAGLKGATMVKWMSESRQELAVNILQGYVPEVKSSIHAADDHKQKVLMSRLLAHFCEEQYKSHNLIEMISKLEKRTAEKKAEIEELKNHFRKLVLSSDEKLSVQRYYSKLKSQYNSDIKETELLLSTRIEFRNTAIKYYLRSIIVDNSTGEDLDKFFSMFFEFSNEDYLQEDLAEDLKLLPSFKLIGWCTQLVSRIGSECTEFQYSLRSLIVKLCHDHPFHSLYQLISLRKHESFATNNKNNAMLAKVTVANEIWQKLQSQSSQFSREILNPADKLCDEAIKLAEYKGVKGRSVYLQKVSIGKYWMNELPAIPPPTLNTPISFNGYSGLTTMQSIDLKLTIAMSGLSLPKIANIILSDGTTHRVLFKSGTDDLRQDSIMEQVFEKVNNIFNTDRETRKRNLRVRTYKAVPLGPQAGMIEFVPNSEALIDIIKPYHNALDKMKADKAKQLMKDEQSTDVFNRNQVYNSIADKIKPVLRHFFFDRFVTPDDWLSSRTRYTRGTATNSMVGYMLGLGDRHCNNILIDTDTGEPIHIDLGVAFDQGKRLPIPETVPFRLTRDIVDGFGITGSKGGFSKSCEHTFRVLRSNKEHILAILDVLRWDPLYNWSISPIRKKKLQDETTDIKRLEPMDDASEAGLAVTTVGDKLVGEGLSVEAMVRELIQMATDPANLSLIYCGWSPFF